MKRALVLFEKGSIATDGSPAKVEEQYGFIGLLKENEITGPTIY